MQSLAIREKLIQSSPRGAGRTTSSALPFLTALPLKRRTINLLRLHVIASCNDKTLLLLFEVSFCFEGRKPFPRFHSDTNETLSSHYILYM